MLYYIMRWPLVQVKICFSTLYPPSHQGPRSLGRARQIQARTISWPRRTACASWKIPSFWSWYWSLNMELQVWFFRNQVSGIALGSPLPEMNSSWFSLGSFRQTFWNKILWILWISYQNTFESLTIRIQANLFLLTAKKYFLLLYTFWISYHHTFESLTNMSLNLSPYTHLMRNISAVHLLCLSWNGSTVTGPCCRLHSRTKVKLSISFIQLHYPNSFRPYYAVATPRD